MACCGKCVQQEYETRRNNTYRTLRDADINCDNPPDSDVDNALAIIDNAIKKDTATVKCGCSTGCDCEPFPNQDPAWGEWRTTAYSHSFKIGKCNYTIIREVEIRSRVFEGQCVYGEKREV